MNDLFNSIGNSVNDGLYKLDKSLHSTIKNTFIDDFIHELQDYLNKSDAMHKLSKLPKDTKLELNEVEEKYVQCYFNHEPYDIPKDMIDFSSKNDNYFRLQLQDDGMYRFVSK